MKRFLGLLVLLVGFACFATVVRADITARIRGTVVDASGAVVPGAQVTILNTDTGYSRVVQTDPNGSFDVLNLPVGTYTIKVAKQGFVTFQQTEVKLVVNQIYVVNASLQVGSISNTVEVNAHPVQVETTSAQQGEVIQNEEFRDMPLLNRNWVQLQQTVPGVVASSDRFTTNFATNGSRSQSNNYLINGADSNDEPLNTPLDQPSPDAIQEVSVITSTLNPEYGRNSGAILNAATKSGTNSFHGTAFEYYRDTFLNARNFFSLTVPPFHQNQFGGTIGGPFKKNKLFGFFSFQRTKQFAGAARLTTVYSPAQRTGDWTLKSNGKPQGPVSGNISPFPLFGDAASPCPVSGGTPCGAGTPYATLFSSNIVPVEDFTLNSSSALANAYWNAFVPLPTPGISNNRFSFSNNTLAATNQYLGRIDFDATPSDQISFYGFASPSRSTSTLPFSGATLPGFGSSQTQALYQWIAGENHIFNANLLNEFKLIYNRFNFNTVNPQTPVLPSSFCGTTSGGTQTCFAINPQDTAGAGLPSASPTGFFRLGFSFNGPQPRIDDTGEVTDNLSYIHGNHTWKFGIDFRRAHVANPFFFVNNGFFAFGGIGTYTTGIPGLDFQLGIPDDYEQTSGNFIDARTWEYYSYIQDQWKVRRNLTLTFGTGWQIDTPLTDHANNSEAIAAFRPGQQSTVFPTAPTGLLFPGDSGITASGYRTHYNNFGPRFGFAYQPFNTWSVRGGYGIYFDNSEEELTLQNLLTPPFALEDFGISDTQGFGIFGFNPSGVPSFNAPYASLDGTTSIPNKYPFTPPKPGTPVDFSFFEPFSINIMDRNFNTPYVMNYNLNIEHQLPGPMVMQIAYVGSQGRRLEGVVEANPLNAPIADPNIFGSLGEQGTFLNSNYNALQTSLQGNTHGLALRASYTYSHGLDNGSSFEDSQGIIIPSNFRLTYGDSAYDARHRFVAAYVYRIPSLHNIMSALPSRVFDGWGLSGVTTFQTGFPITLTDSSDGSGQCNAAVTFYGCWDRPQVVGPLQFENPRTSAGNLWFNPAAFAVETPGVLGNAGRNFFHGPGINNWDIGVFKDTKITESIAFQLRADMFNGFNHAQFANPGGDVNSSTFGEISSTQVAARIVQLGAHLTF